MKGSAVNKILAVKIEKILTKVENGKLLTLEEAMLATYKKSCVRVLPSSREARGYKRGSKLILKDRIIIVCYKGDERFCKPIMNMVAKAVLQVDSHPEILPESLVITDSEYIYVTTEKNLKKKSDWCRFINKDVVKVGSPISHSRSALKARSMFDDNSKVGHLRLVSCPEEAGLMGKLSAKRIVEALSGKSEYV